MGRTALVTESGGLNSFIGTGKLFSDTEIDLLWRNLATDGKNVIGVIPNTNIVIEPFKRSDYKGFKSGMTSFPDGTHVWGPVETFDEVKEAVIGEEIKIFDAEAIRSSLQELSHQHLSVLRASVRHDQLVPIVNKAEANLNLMDSSLLVTAAVLSVLPKVCRRKEVQVGLSVILVGSLLLVACNEALTSPPPAVKITPGIPTRIYPTETPEPTFVPTPKPEIIVPAGGGGSEFTPGTAQEFQAKLAATGNYPSALRYKVGTKEYETAKFELEKLGANIDGLKISLEPKIKQIPGAELYLIKQEGWGFLITDGKNIYWSVNKSGTFFNHMDSVPVNQEFGLAGLSPRQYHKLDVIISGGIPFVVERNSAGYPVRRFSPEIGEFIDLNWQLVSENDHLSERLDWSGVSNALMVDGKLHVSGLNDSVLAVNRSAEIVHTGDFSFGTILSGNGSGVAFMSEGVNKLDVIINRNPGGGLDRLGIVYRKNGFSTTPVINSSAVIPKGNGLENIVEVKFRPNENKNNVAVIVDGQEVTVITIDGLLRSGKLSLGVTAKSGNETVILDMFLKAPYGGVDNAKLVSLLIKPTATSTAAPIITSRPQFTPAPTFTKTPEPGKGEGELITYEQGQGLLSNLSLLKKCLTYGNMAISEEREINGWKYYDKKVGSVEGTKITYYDGKSIDVGGAKRVVLYVFPKVYTPGSIEIIHMTTINPKDVLPYLDPGDYAGITISPDGKVNSLFLLCYYK